MAGIPREIVYTRYEGRRAIEWLRQSYAMFSRARLAWVLLLFAYGFALLVVAALPLIGPILFFLLKPVFAVGFLAATWTQERGGAPALSQLFQGFRSNLWRLVPLGVVLLVGTQLAFASTALIDGGKLLAFVTESGSGNLDQEAMLQRWEETLGDWRVQAGMLFAILCAMPTVLALWWAPALVVFQNATIGLALGVSLRAALVNWRAILRYLLTAFVFVTVLPSLAWTIMVLLLPAPAAVVMLFLLLLPYWVAVAATLQICEYVSYRDVFHAGETLAPLTRGGDQHAR
jgi:hypothetical protein